MSSGNTNFNTIAHESRWIVTIDNYFSEDDHEAVDIFDPQKFRCVFRVPKASTETKLEAYSPRSLGLGPYHHLRPELYHMQLQKLSRVRTFLGPDKLQVFEQVVTVLIQNELIVRACYDEYLDFDIKSLARILAVDSFYLLMFFDARKSGQITEQVMKTVAADILMMENQIPVVLLNEILKIIQHHQIIGSQYHVLTAEFHDFCQTYSPLALDPHQSGNINGRQQHILHRMYHCIINNRGGHPISTASVLRSGELVKNFNTILGVFGVQTEAPAQILEIVERAKKIRDQLKGGAVTPNEEAACLSPTASELSETAGVKFKCMPEDGGIKVINYNVAGKILTLPRVKLDSNSEIVMRNLVAYEAASATAESRLWLTEYVDLMCGMIRSDKDVDVLKKAKIIIEGEMSDEEIVRVFNGIGKSMRDNEKRRSNIVEEVSKSYDDVRSVRVKKFVKKCLSVSWKIISNVVAVAVLVVLVVQAFCSLFGCTRWFGRSAPVQAFRFLYADN